MSSYTDYADRASERYTEATLEIGSLFAQRGPSYAVRDLPQAQKALVDARKRVREEKIREALGERPSLDVLLLAPLGPLAPISKIVNQEPRVVLLSKAGAGKSAALRYLATHRLSGKSGDLLTFVVDLPALAASGQSLPEYLAADAKGQMSLALSADFFQEVLSTGQALVCLDGLDEIAGQEARTHVVEQIESWIERFPGCRYIITARANAYEPAFSLDKFAHYTLVPWSETVAEDLESAWQEASADWTEEEASAQLIAAPRLLKDTLAARDVVALFDDGEVDAIWPEIQSHLSDVGWRERIALVYRFLSQEQPEAWAEMMSLLLDAEEGDSFDPILQRRLSFAAAALAASEVSDDLDLDVRKRVVDGLIEWLVNAEAVGRQKAVDALFQLSDEPYAAERILQVVADAEIDNWAREAAALLAGRLCVASPAEAVEALYACADEPEGYVRMCQAACTSLGYLGGSATLDDEMRGEIVEGLISRVRSDEFSIDVLVALTEALGVILLAGQEERVLEELVSLARGEGQEKVYYSVQMAAGRMLSALLVKAEGDQLVERMWALARDEEVDESVRTILTETLGVQGDAQGAANVLLEIAKNAKFYPPAHREALETLGRLGYSDESIVEGLLEIAGTTDRKTKDFERLAAAQALGEIGHIDLALQYLLMLIADKSIYRTTRNDALSYLGETGLSGDEDLDNAAIAVLQVWVTEENTTEDVRERAMESLALLRAGREEVVRELIGVVQDKKDFSRVRRAAVYTLARLPIEQKDVVVESLSTPFYDPDETSDLLRVPIAHLLYLWGENEQALEYLKSAAEQSYMALVRYRAGIVLKELGDTENAVATLLKLATDSSIADPIRCDSLRALSFWNVGDEDLARQLLPILVEEEDPMPSVREATFAALESLLA